MDTVRHHVYVGAFVQSSYDGPGLLSHRCVRHEKVGPQPDGMIPCDKQAAVEAMRLCGRKSQSEAYIVWLPTFVLDDWSDEGVGAYFWFADDEVSGLTWVCGPRPYKFAKQPHRPGWCEFTVNGTVIEHGVYRDTGRIVYTAPIETEPMLFIEQHDEKKDDKDAIANA